MGRLIRRGSPSTRKLRPHDQMRRPEKRRGNGGAAAPFKRTEPAAVAGEAVERLDAAEHAPLSHARRLTIGHGRQPRAPLRSHRRRSLL